MDHVRAAKQSLVEVSRKIAARGLVVGPGGNISARVDDSVVISASGSSFEDASESDFVTVALDSGRKLDGDGNPSSEWLMHLLCYRHRADVNAVVHTHPPLSIAVASSGTTLEPMFPDFAAFIESLAYLDYIIPTTARLAEAVGEKVKAHDALLLSNHGVVTVGSSLKEALLRTELIEESACILIAARTLGTPRLLTQSEVEEIRNLNAEKYRQRLIKEGSSPDHA